MTRMNKQQVVDHWCHASRLEGVDHTRGTQAATEQSKAFLQTLMDLIDIEQARYRYLAQRICDVYWEHNIAHRTDQTEGYPGHHGCRVRLRGRKLELSWYTIHSCQKKAEPDTPFTANIFLKRVSTGISSLHSRVRKTGKIQLLQI